MLGLGVVDLDTTCSGLKTLSSSGIGVRGRNLAPVGIASTPVPVFSTAIACSVMSGVDFCEIERKIIIDLFMLRSASPLFVPRWPWRMSVKLISFLVQL